MKFLHIADVHLGCTRYQLAESPRDFFDAWIDVIQRYAVAERVDFVIMCGDFFHKKAVPPETMNYAVEGLNLLKDQGIPVIAIEGNHDQHYNDSDYSWLRSLANWNFVHLLEPEMLEGEIIYSVWNPETKRGGYLDIGQTRIFGSHWYGAQGNIAIPKLTDSIRTNRREGAFHILLLHTDVEGHQMHPIPALSIESLKKLKDVTDYVALGHTHMHYEIDNWAFNPGSIEVTNISEYRETRGAFLVTVTDDNSFSVEHMTDYHHRPFQRITFDVTRFTEAKLVTDALLEDVRLKARAAEEGRPAPIIEVTLTGQLGFPNSLLEMKKIRDGVMKITGALHVRIKNVSIPVEIGEMYDSQEDEGRERVERRVVELIVAKDKRFSKNRTAISDAVVGAKRMALSDDEPEKIAEFIAAQVADV
ncbi:MAG: exonuclease SbcCD subunit D [Pyrinomonadaceae bacterium]